MKLWLIKLIVIVKPIQIIMASDEIIKLMIEFLNIKASNLHEFGKIFKFNQE